MCVAAHPEADDSSGFEPAGLHIEATQVRVPTTLKEAKPKAGSIAANAIGHACAPQVATRIAHGRHPEANIDSSQARSLISLTLTIEQRTGSTRRKQIGSGGAMKWHVGSATQR